MFFKDPFVVLSGRKARSFTHSSSKVVSSIAVFSFVPEDQRLLNETELERQAERQDGSCAV